MSEINEAIRPMVEIERKFLLSVTLQDIIDDAMAEGRAPASETIEQVYLPDTGKWTIRGRMTRVEEFGKTDYLLTMKRRIDALMCHEIEHHITALHYCTLRDLAQHEPLRKRRWHHSPSGFVIDEFLNDRLADFRIAEVELDAPDQPITLPWFVGEEITGKMSNQDLALIYLCHG